MLSNIGKLEKEREELLEVITGLESWRRYAIDDQSIISLHITSHMMRLSALDEEIQQARTQRETHAIKA